MAANSLKGSLEYSIDSRADVLNIFPYFVDAPTLKVTSDSDFKNLEVSIDATLYDEGVRDGSRLAIPRLAETPSLPDTSKAVNACAKDAVQDFAKWIVFYLKNENQIPKESLKVQMRFVTSVGEPKRDKYGNIDTSDIQQKVLATTLIHISRTNLDRIESAFSPDDYFALSDLATPKVSQFLESVRTIRFVGIVV